MVATNGWTDGSAHPLFPGDIIKVPVVSCTTASSTPPTQTVPESQLNDPEWVFSQVLNWGNVDGGEYEGQYTDSTCTEAYWANFDLERDQTDDVEAAIAGLASLSIPVPDDLRAFMEREAVLFRLYGNDFRRIVDTFVSSGGSAEAARADPMYATVAAALVEFLRAGFPAFDGTDLIRPVCAQFEVHD